MSPRKRTATVSFRADADFLRLLDEARRRFGVSRGEWVRGAIHTILYSTERERRDQQLADLQRVLDELAEGQRELRTHHARGLFAVLTIAGQMPAEEARQLIRENLKH
ncbi:MAG: hypothetical protein K1X74_06185 [Pirellulales bacterium]|nr:hypothetical protein [Pirellulales bacterium]